MRKERKPEKTHSLVGCCGRGPSGRCVSCGTDAGSPPPGRSRLFPAADRRVAGVGRLRHPAGPFTGEERFHQGVDLACAEGTAVLAVREGVATAARRSDSYGVCLQLLHPDGTETLYAHLQYLYVRTGETVQAGQILGTAGQTGRATGAHLHFELRRQGTACDPSALLGLSDA